MLLRRIARPLLAGIFISGGINQLRDAEGHAKVVEPVVDRVVELVPVEEPPSHVTLVRVDAAVKIGAGTMLALGKAPRLSAAALVASLVPTTLAAHRFWEIEDPEQRRLQQVQFVKNLGLLGGLLLAVADTEGKPSLAWRARRAGRTSAATAELIHRDLTSGLGRLSERVSEVSETAADTAGRLGGQAAEVAGRFGEQASEIASRLGEQAPVVAGRASEIASRLGEQAPVVAGRASERAAAVAGKVGERLSERTEQLLAEAERLRAEAEKQAAVLTKRARTASKRTSRRAGKRIDRLNRRADKRVKRAAKRAEKLRETLPKQAAKRAQKLRETLPKQTAEQAERLRSALSR